MSEHAAHIWRTLLAKAEVLSEHAPARTGFKKATCPPARAVSLLNMSKGSAPAPQHFAPSKHTTLSPLPQNSARV